MKSKFIESRFYKFSVRFNLIYLLIPILVYVVMGFCYILATKINNEGIVLTFKIDSYIPFVKYFSLPYMTYYFVPIILLWAVSFKSKRLYYIFLVALCINNFSCYIFYCFYNVKVIRESSVNLNMKLSDINSFDGIFDYLVSFIYNRDLAALNSLPSIHASTGLLMILMCIPNKVCKLKLGLIIFGIVSGIGCILSTVFIKQHNLIDIAFGILWMTIIYATIIFVSKKIKTSSVAN